MRRILALALAGGLILVAPSTVRADGQAAQSYLKEAQDLIDQNDFQSAADKVEASDKIDNTIDVKVKGEYAEPVDAVVIYIIAAKIGPFAGAKDRGVLKEDGTLAK